MKKYANFLFRTFVVVINILPWVLPIFVVVGPRHAVGYTFSWMQIFPANTAHDMFAIKPLNDGSSGYFGLLGESGNFCNIIPSKFDAGPKDPVRLDMLATPRKLTAQNQVSKNQNMVSCSHFNFAFGNERIRMQNFLHSEMCYQTF